MNTVHSYTENQRLLDSAHADPRRSRAAGQNVIPIATTTPAALGKLMPELAGRIAGLAVRVPTPAVAMLDLVALVDRPAPAAAVRDAFRAAGARLLLASHAGRPKDAPDPRYSLRPVAAKLAELLGRPVLFAEDCVGAPAEQVATELQPGGVTLLENLRFHAGEKKNDPAFAAQLAALAEAYVDDAFGSAHRAHASVVGVPERLARKAAGRLLVREVTALSRLLGEPERPFAILLGGAKIEDKIDTLENLLPRLDLLLMGGGMANTFLSAQGHDMAASLVETDRLEVARDILARAK